jgi:hypothetical protein
MTHVKDLAAAQNRPSLFVSLPKPPSAIQLTVRKLISRVQEGAIRVPGFQRPLRWRADDVVKLFDSILKGYPIGSILFWKHPFEPTSDLRVGAATIDGLGHADGWYIVDGQQRVTALAAALLDLDHGGDPRWEIWFAPEENHFHAGAPRAEERGKHVPLTALGDLRRLGRWFQQCALSEEQQTRVEEVQQRLLDYEIPGYVVDTDNMDALRGVFARMNSTGVRMRAEEVFQALLGQGESGNRGKKGVDLVELQRAADLDGFGEPPRAEVLKALLAMSDLDPLKRLEELGESAVEQLVDGSEALEAIQRTASFLQRPPDAAEPGAGIPAYAFIPYPVAFVILARWFHHFPEPDEPTRRALGTWLWRGVATAVHQRAAVSALRLQIREIKADDMTGSLTRLLAAVGEPKSSEWSTLDPFHANHAASRVELLALLTRQPRDVTGNLVSFRALLSSGERVAREILSVTKFEEGPLRKLARTAANRALLDARHTNLAAEFKQWTWEHDREALESHLIDRDGFDALCRGDHAKLLEGRAARLRTLVSRFLSQRAGLGQPRLLPVQAYYDSAMGQAPEPRRP